MSSAIRNADQLDESIKAARQAVDATPENHPDVATRLNVLAMRLGERFDSFGAIGDLDYGIMAARQAVYATPKDSIYRAERLNNLGVDLGNRFRMTRSITDLEEAIEITREAVDAFALDHPNRADMLNTLSVRLGNRYQAIGTRGDLEESLQIARQAVEASSEGSPAHGAALTNLANRLGDLFHMTGKMDDLDDAVDVARHAVSVTPSHHGRRARRLNNLVARLGDRFTRTAVIDDLEEAIGFAREAIEILPERHPDQAESLHNLSIELGDRFRWAGAMVDLDEAIQSARRAINMTPQLHFDRARRLDNLGIRLGDRYGRNGTILDLEEAIDTAQEAIQCTAEDNPDRAVRLSNLSLRLGERYNKSRILADLDKAITVATQAMEVTASDRPHRTAIFNNLGVRLDERFNATGALTDLNEAIAIAQKAVDSASRGSPDRAGALINLAHRLRKRCHMMQSKADCEKEYESLLEAFDDTNASVSMRVRAARDLMSSESARKHNSSTLKVAGDAIDLLPRLVPRFLQNADKQDLLLQAAGLATDAAALSLFFRQPPAKALSWLESGRGLLASALQDLRIDLSALRQEHSELAADFERAQYILGKSGLENASVLENSEPLSPQKAMEQRQQAEERLDGTLQNIRTKPGFERFLLPLTEGEILSSGLSAVVVFINVSIHRSDALVVTNDGIECVELPDLSYEETLKKREGISSSSSVMLEWLWDCAVHLIIQSIPLSVTADGLTPHLLWIPTGPLVGFPLHAAGYHTKEKGRTALDCVRSTYAISLRSVLSTKGLQLPEQAPRSLVLVAMDKTPGVSPLNHAIQEITAVRDMGELLHTDQKMPQSTKQAVQQALADCEIFHFAGHGNSDPAQPLRSCLLLQDWQQNPFTVADLLDLALNRRRPFLAYLSACGTGQILKNQSVDESMHLSSAFQLAGYRHVIGTLWSVDDALCVQMARLVYEFLAKQGLKDSSVSCALHHATKHLRDEWVQNHRTARESSNQEEKATKLRDLDFFEGEEVQESRMPLWVPYIHYGV